VFEPIIRKTHAVREVDGEVVSRGLDGVALDDLLPKDKENFFTYEGSLTTPDCNEVVSWIVLKDRATISENQIKLFRELEVWQGPQGRLKKNFRPLQELNTRVILDRVA
jgi:carbonic anhydrase